MSFIYTNYKIFKENKENKELLKKIKEYFKNDDSPEVPSVPPNKEDTLKDYPVDNYIDFFKYYKHGKYQGFVYFAKYLVKDILDKENINYNDQNIKMDDSYDEQQAELIFKYQNSRKFKEKDKTIDHYLFFMLFREDSIPISVEKVSLDNDFEPGSFLRKDAKKDFKENYKKIKEKEEGTEKEQNDDDKIHKSQKISF